MNGPRHLSNATMGVFQERESVKGTLVSETRPSCPHRTHVNVVVCTSRNRRNGNTTSFCTQPALIKQVRGDSTWNLTKAPNKHNPRPRSLCVNWYTYRVLIHPYREREVVKHREIKQRERMREIDRNVNMGPNKFHPTKRVANTIGRRGKRDTQRDLVSGLGGREKEAEERVQTTTDTGKVTGAWGVLGVHSPGA